MVHMKRLLGMISRDQGYKSCVCGVSRSGVVQRHGVLCVRVERVAVNICSGQRDLCLCLSLCLSLSLARSNALARALSLAVNICNAVFISVQNLYLRWSTRLALLSLPTIQTLVQWRRMRRRKRRRRRSGIPNARDNSIGGREDISGFGICKSLYRGAFALANA